MTGRAPPGFCMRRRHGGVRASPAAATPAAAARAASPRPVPQRARCRSGRTLAVRVGPDGAGRHDSACRQGPNPAYPARPNAQHSMRLRTSLFALALAAGPAAAQTPQFAAPVQNPFGLVQAGAGVRSIPALCDLDRDGDPDLLVGYEDGSFRYTQNTAAAGQRAAFAASVLAPFGLAAGGAFMMPTAGDLDRDGDTDVLVGNNTGSFLYYRNTAGAGATPAFAAPVANPFGLAALANQALPAIADLDRDGDADVLAADRTVFRYFENTAGPNATPVFLAAVANPFGLAPASNSPAPAVGDVDTDGDLDLLAGESVGRFYFFRNTRPVATEPALARADALGAPVPNPAAAGATLALTLGAAQTVAVEVVDALGRVVARQTVAAGAGETLLRVGTRGLPAGVYVVRVRGAGLSASRRLTVAR